MVVKCGVEACGVEFKTKHSRQRYCSPACSKEAKRLRDLHLERDARCKRCDAPFDPERTRACYCSEECKRKARLSRRGGPTPRKAKPKKAKTPETKPSDIIWQNGGLTILRFKSPDMRKVKKK